MSRPQYQGRVMAREMMEFLGITAYQDHGQVVSETTGEIVLREEIWIGERSLKVDMPAYNLATLAPEEVAQRRALNMTAAVEALKGCSSN